LHVHSSTSTAWGPTAAGPVAPPLGGRRGPGRGISARGRSTTRPRRPTTTPAVRHADHAPSDRRATAAGPLRGSGGCPRAGHPPAVLGRLPSSSPHRSRRTARPERPQRCLGDSMRGDVDSRLLLSAGERVHTRGPRPGVAEGQVSGQPLARPPVPPDSIAMRAAAGLLRLKLVKGLPRGGDRQHARARSAPWRHRPAARDSRQVGSPVFASCGLLSSWHTVGGSKSFQGDWSRCAVN